MRRHPWRAPLALLTAAAAALLWAARRDLNEPHIRLFTDMVFSPAARSQRASAVLRDGRVEQEPPAGTIPRGFSPFPYGPGQEERARAARELKNPVEPSFETMARGKHVFESYCAHCHGLKGRGDGPVAKDFPAFSFAVAGPSSYQLKDGELFHIITYGRNLMPAHAAQVPQEDRWKVVLYLRDLQRREIARLGPLGAIPEDPRRHGLISAAYGKELFAQNCAACHGAEGRHPQPGIPTLNEPSVLAVAEDAYYWDIINHGRRGTQMPAWKDVLSPTQIKSVIAYIRSFSPPAPERPRILADRGDAGRGKALFSTHCAGCHGPEGKGGIGNSLSAPSFLAIASDPFLRDTIAMGRAHTAMPSSYDLKAEDVSDLIAYVKSWSKPAPPFSEVERLLPQASQAEGQKVFASRCAGCHGEKGEGGIGSRLNSDGFLSMFGNASLYRAITEGRPGTEMPAWRLLPAQDLADVISYIRGWQKAPTLVSTETAKGRPEFGEVLFKNECVKCHMAGGAGDLGTQIGNPALLAQESDQFLWRTIAYGKKDTEMKGFLNRARNPLSADDIRHLVAYLRQLQKNPPLDGLKRTYSWASASDGKKVYEGKGGCIKCHGPQGQGGSGPSLGSPGFQKVASAGFLAATIVLGRENTPMKSYHRGGDVELAEEDVENVAAYILSLEKNPPKETRRVERTAERAQAGRELFAHNCASCHGGRGQGRHGTRPGEFAPSLNNQDFLKAADDNFLLATIALGRPGTPMPAFALGASGPAAKLTADEIRELVAFLRSWEEVR